VKLDLKRKKEEVRDVVRDQKSQRENIMNPNMKTVPKYEEVPEIEVAVNAERNEVIEENGELKEATEVIAEQIEVIEENEELKEATEANAEQKEAIEASVVQKEASEVNAELIEVIVEQKEAEDIVIVKNITHQDPVAKIEMKKEKLKEKSDHHTEPEVPVVVGDMKNEEVAVNIVNPKSQKNMTVINTARVITVRARVVEQKEVPEAKMFLEVKEVDTEMKDKTKDPLVETMEMFINHLKSVKTIITLIVLAEAVIVVPCVEVLQEDTVTMILTKNPRRVTLLLGNYLANMAEVNQHMTNLMNTVNIVSIENQESTEAVETVSTEVEAEVDMEETEIITKAVVTVVEAVAMVVNIVAQASTEAVVVENTEAVEMANTEAEVVVTNTENHESTEAVETASTEAEVATTMSTAEEVNTEVEVVASNSTTMDIKTTTISHTNVVEGTETTIIKKIKTHTKPLKMIPLP
jgi:hypothetical protein